MKKFIILAIALACVIGLIIWSNILPKKQFVSNGNSHSDVEGVFVVVDSINYYRDKTTLKVSWNNKTKHKVLYGAMFGIERLVDGKWIDCSIEDNVFALIGYSLNENESVKNEYLLTDMFDISKSGTYRFCSDYSLLGDEKECSVWTEFVIES